MGNTGGMARSLIRCIAIVAAFVAVAGCTTRIENHGYVPSDENLAQVTVGVDTRESVAAAIGSPTAGGVLNASGYYYVASKFRHYGPLEPKEIDRQVVAVTFSQAGIVQNIARYTLADGRVVTLSRRVTDDNVRDATLIRQLLGNLGQFNAGDFIGSGTDTN
jgi:outer membrane protein assembly factor BamE (lipoprotein component of BamABCDE complex)